MQTVQSLILEHLEEIKETSKFTTVDPQEIEYVIFMMKRFDPQETIDPSVAWWHFKNS